MEAVTTPHPVQKLIEQIAKGVFDDETLELALSHSRNLVLTNMRDRFICLESCPDCEKTRFAINLGSVYSGTKYICSACLTRYRFCRECNSYVLAEDNSLHIHSEDLRQNAHLNRTREHNENIMNDLPPLRSTTRDRAPRWSHPRYIGVEIELEKKVGQLLPPDLILKAYRALSEGFVLVKRDGSLGAVPGGMRGSNGFEVVSVPATLDYHLTEAGWDKFFTALSPWMQERALATGLHFHVSANSMTTATIARISRFMNEKANLEFLKVMAGRDFTMPNPNGREYAKVFHNTAQKVREVVSRRIHEPSCPMSPAMRLIRKYYGGPDKVRVDVYSNPIIASINPTNSGVAPCRCPQGMYDYGGHYAAFNLRTQRPTIEFRMFQATTDQLQFFAAMEFCVSLISFCESHSFSEMNPEMFLNWFKSNRHLYRNLDKFLVIAGFIQKVKK